MALGFPCFVFGLVGFVFGCVPMALASPCILIGLLASPLCGAAKKAGCNRQPVVSHLGHPPGTAQNEIVSRTASASDTGLIHPASALRARRMGWLYCDACECVRGVGGECLDT
jgi:hypothetical protein